MNFSQIDMTMSNSYYEWMAQVSERENHPEEAMKTSWIKKVYSLFR